MIAYSLLIKAWHIYLVKWEHHFNVSCHFRKLNLQITVLLVGAQEFATKSLSRKLFMLVLCSCPKLLELWEAVSFVHFAASS